MMRTPGNILRGAARGTRAGAQAAQGSNRRVADVTTGRFLMRGGSRPGDAQELEKMRGQDRENAATARQMLDELARMNRRRS